MSKKKTLMVLAFVLLLITTVAIVLIFRNPKNDENPPGTLPDSLPTETSTSQNDDLVLREPNLMREGMFYGVVPENIRPVILVNGTRYYWVGKTYLLEGADIPNGYVGRWSGVNYIPGNYTEYGSLKEVSKEEPTEDGQMKAGFAASGTIYTSEETPEAVYVCMTSDFTGEKRYTRFISEELDKGYRVMWNGNYYYVAHAKCIEISEVPDTCECVGTMHYIGMDRIPEQDLETNATSDGKARSLEGCEVFFDANEPEFIYFEVKSPDSGDVLRVYKCPLLDAE